MTREFNKQRRDESRPSFRNAPSNRYGDERSSRPARPRLNRETVDRAWENGASRVHADYHPRNTNGSAPRNSWRNNQNSTYSSQQGPGGNRAYGNRQEQQRNGTPGGRRSFNSNQGPRSRSFDANTHYSDHQRYDTRGGYNDEPYRSGGRQAPGGRAQPQSRGPQPRNQQGNGQGFNRGTQPQGRGYAPRGQQNDRGWRGPERSNRADNDFNGNDRYGRRAFDGRAAYGEPPAQRGNPRRRAWEPRGQQDTRHSQEDTEQFVGDYEHFGTQDTPRRYPKQNGGQDPHNQAPLRHVTPLPDGRVLKGPRPVQRKNAQFWQSVAEDTEDIIGHVHAPDAQETAQPTTDAEEPEQAHPEIGTRTKTTKRIASAARRKKADTGKPRSSGPRPSQRGYKWPTA